jgi:hypothetical protein
VAERLLALQAQDLRGVRLAFRPRGRGLTAADVDRALTEDRSLVISWLNRGTLHLVRSADLPWLRALTGPPQRTTALKRLADDGLSPDDAERGAACVAAALAEEGPLVRAELADRLAAAGVRAGGQAAYHLLWLVCLRGEAVRGPVRGREQAYVLTRDWLGPGADAPVDRDTALAELARRYLAGHGPAGPRDLARWAGIGLRDARAGFGAIAAQLVPAGEDLVDLAGRPPVEDLPPPRLLGPFDPLLHGWAGREDVVGEHRGIITVNGIFRAFALAGGRAVATWTMPAGRVQLAPLEPIAPADAAALEEDAADVARFLGR